MANIYDHYRAQGKDNATRQGWVSAEKQRANYDTMTLLMLQAGLKLPDLSVHDAGCGLGDFLTYLDAHGGCRRYFGTDISDIYLAGAVEAHPRTDYRPEATFQKLDLMREPPLMADFTVCFGTLAFYKPRQIEALLPKLWKASARGLGFITWWNLDESFVYHEHIQTLQKVIRRFIREAKPSAHFERIGDYGEPTEAAFLLVR